MVMELTLDRVACVRLLAHKTVSHATLSCLSVMIICLSVCLGLSPLYLSDSINPFCIAFADTLSTDVFVLFFVYSYKYYLKMAMLIGRLVSGGDQSNAVVVCKKLITGLANSIRSADRQG